jgi:hypothetical protein
MKLFLENYKIQTFSLYLASTKTIFGSVSEITWAMDSTDCSPWMGTKSGPTSRPPDEVSGVAGREEGEERMRRRNWGSEGKDWEEGEEVLLRKESRGRGVT